MESHDHNQLSVPLDGSRRSFLGALLWVGVGVCWRPVSGSGPALHLLSIDSKRRRFRLDGSWLSRKCFRRPNAAAPHARPQAARWLAGDSQPTGRLRHQGRLAQLKVLSAICPHLGCTVPWDPGRNEFVCPCHGGTFSADGSTLSGPPRRSLDSLDTKVSDGKLLVKYQ